MTIERPVCIASYWWLRLRVPVLLTVVWVHSLLGICAPVGADVLPLLVEVELSTSQMRTTGPIPVSLRLQWAGPRPVLMGDLILNLVDSSGSRVATAVLDNLHVSMGVQRLEFFFPALDSDQRDTQYTIRPSFVTTTGTTTLRELNLFLSGAARRTFVATIVGVSEPQDRDEAVRFGEGLRFERFFNVDRSQGETSPAVTLFRREQARELPTNPLTHCRQDLLILAQGAFGALSTPQLTAVVAWVRAGGSVAVFLDNSPLSGSHLDVLNSLMEQTPESGLIARNSSGEILWPEEGRRFVSGSLGLGYAVIADATEIDRLLGEDLPREWNDIVCNLWNVRKDQREITSRNGVFEVATMYDFSLQQAAYAGRLPQSGFPGKWNLHPQPIAGGSALLRETLPKELQVVPLWLMGLMLLLYVVLIGPGEYLGLGFLRARKYTWITFPLITLLISGAGIALSNLMMGTGDQGGSVNFVDVTASGHIARENEIRLLFSSRSGSEAIPIVNALYSPLDHRRLGAQNPYTVRSTGSRDVNPVPPIVRGMLPNRGTVVESVSQWSPKFYRTLKIPAEPKLEPSGFDWTAPIDPRDSRSLAQLRSRLVESFGPEVRSKLWRHNGRIDTEIGGYLEAGEQLDDLDVVGTGPLMLANDEQMMLLVTRDNTRVTTYESPDVLKCTSIQESLGLFSIVASVAPKCDNFLEDLAVLDPSDENLWLLIVMVPDRNRTTVYRRIVRVD